MNKSLTSALLGILLTGCSSLHNQEIIEGNRVKIEKYSLNGRVVTEVDPRGVVTVIYDFNGDKRVDMVEVSNCSGTVKYWKGDRSGKETFNKAERRFLNYK